MFLGYVHFYGYKLLFIVDIPPIHKVKLPIGIVEQYHIHVYIFDRTQINDLDIIVVVVRGRYSFGALNRSVLVVSF